MATTPFDAETLKKRHAEGPAKETRQPEHGATAPSADPLRDVADGRRLQSQGGAGKLNR